MSLAQKTDFSNAIPMNNQSTSRTDDLYDLYDLFPLQFMT